MMTFIIRRIGSVIPVMLIVALFVFNLIYFAPGDPASVIAGDQASAATIAQIREQMGLDRPYFERFVDWLGNILRGNLGISVFTSMPVTQLILQRLEPTLSLMFLTLVLSVGIAVPLGVLAAWKVKSWVDQSVMAFAV